VAEKKKGVSPECPQDDSIETRGSAFLKGIPDPRAESPSSSKRDVLRLQKTPGTDTMPKRIHRERAAFS